MIKMSRNHAMQIWVKLKEDEGKVEFPIGWNLMGLKFLSIDKCPEPSILDRILYFEVVNKNKFAWLIMQYNVEYESCNSEERRLYQNFSERS
jgi:hypothetical protein